MDAESRHALCSSLAEPLRACVGVMHIRRAEKEVLSGEGKRCASSLTAVTRGLFFLSSTSAFVYYAIAAKPSKHPTRCGRGQPRGRVDVSSPILSAETPASLGVALAS